MAETIARCRADRAHVPTILSTIEGKSISGRGAFQKAFHGPRRHAQHPPHMSRHMARMCETCGQGDRCYCQRIPHEQTLRRLTVHCSRSNSLQPCGAGWSIWPSAMITDPVSNHGLIFYTVQNVPATGGFQGVGSSVAIWSSFDQLPQRPTFSPAIVADHPDLMFSQSEPTFGSTARTKAAESERLFHRRSRTARRGRSMPATGTGSLQLARPFRSSTAWTS
jgi:hypothetical protein